MNRTMITSFYRWWFSLHPSYVISSTEWMCLGNPAKRGPFCPSPPSFARNKGRRMIDTPDCRL